ncbi:homoserine kinase [Ensifer sesbaniae]|uniref:homoserine kinase n=1 Tax=Ensifer sesbaniae TaxID=1214071 RepID=UPI001568CD75|nr:homoserine kinase [Ensifer sesbaniae]NRQ19119.1 Homoserine kinase [Ensifer sesbaniae]
MAVFTELSDEDRHAIVEAYGLTGLSSVIGIADGDRETTYLFRSAEGEFIVTLFENGAEPLDLERAFTTMETLHRAGVPCPEPRRTVDGNATFQAAGRLVAIVSFVSGSSTSDPSPAKCASVGRVMGQIHRSLQGGLNRQPDLPSGPIHGALVFANVFFLGEEVSGVINFRLRHDDALITEIADVLVDWTGGLDGGLDRRKAHALLSGYQTIRKLSGAEKAALPAFVLASTAKRAAAGARMTSAPECALVAYHSVTPDIFDQ